jgi:hypothetical protein
MSASSSFGQWRVRRESTRITPVTVELLWCVECGRSSDDASGWRVGRIDDPEDEDPRPQLGFYCPTCAEREFGA